MLKSNFLKVIILMSIMVVLLLSTITYASDGSMQDVVPKVTEAPSTTVATSTPSVTSTSTPKSTPTPTPTSQTKLPQTGIENYTGLIFVTIILIGSAVFAYNKIKKYDNI